MSCKGTLWCEAVAQTSGRQVDCSDEEDLTDDQEEEIQPKRKNKTKSLAEEKRERIQKIVDDLKAKHGVQFSGPQYRLWAESIDINQHDSLDTPPIGCMLKKQASSVPCGRRVSATAVASVVQNCPEAQKSCFLTLTPI